MDDIADFIDKFDEYCAELQILAQGYMEQVRLLLCGSQSAQSISAAENGGIVENELIPPHSTPEPSKISTSEYSELQSSESFVRPTCAAKLKSINCLKEPKLHQKLQKVKLEKDQRRSQIRAKLTDAPMAKVTAGNKQLSDEQTKSAPTFTITSNKGKKIVTHKPIKVERFNDIDKYAMPRTCNRGARNSGGSVYEDSVDHMSSEITNASIMPPAVNKIVTPQTAGKMNAIVASGAYTDDTFYANVAQTSMQIDVAPATFVVHNQNENAAVTIDKNALTDTTFKITQKNLTTEDTHNTKKLSQQCMETAKDTIRSEHDSLIKEDESLQPEKPDTLINELSNPSGTLIKLLSSTPTPARKNELFNPLLQSSVKKKVQAFENVAMAEFNKSKHPKRIKQNAAAVTTTPVTVSKLHTPLDRFLIPNQASNRTPGSLAQVWKGSSSCSKVLGVPTAGTTIKHGGGLVKTKAPSHGNGGDDFRKDLHNLAEERKKQREQKRLLASQQRETKERERAECLYKLCKEREEKLLKKQQLAIEKKRAMEAAAAVKAAKLKATKEKEMAAQERKLLEQLKPNKTQAASKIQLPLAKMQSIYTFEMLHEDDSTDGEDQASSQRPPPPKWSRSDVRGPAISAQQHWPTKVVDAFFSVQPMSPDLRAIFPKISSRQLNRNSSAVWTTPPPYSELPKY